MKRSNRYSTSHLIEDQYQEGSKRMVLKNLLNIKSKLEIDRAETIELKKAEDKILKKYDQDHRFTVEDVCLIHRLWLRKIYEWAGNFRQVNLSKGGFPFAPAKQIPTLMAEFERKFLAQYTPCKLKSRGAIIEAMAVVHTELILIHPFREGNGRIARLLATLMALQAGLPLLNFGSIQGQFKSKYFQAVQYGLDRNYEPMKKIFEEVIKKTILSF